MMTSTYYKVKCVLIFAFLLLQLPMISYSQDTLVFCNGHSYLTSSVSVTKGSVCFKRYGTSRPVYKYPVEFVTRLSDRYGKVSYYSHEDLGNRLSHSTIPFIWDELRYANTEEAEIFRQAVINTYNLRKDEFQNLDSTPQGQMIQKVFQKMRSSLEKLFDSYAMGDYFSNFEWEVNYYGCLTGSHSHVGHQNCPLMARYESNSIRNYHAMLHNASSFGYGKIFLGYDLCNNFNENELAVVIGHEMGHAIANHSIEKYFKTKNTIKLAEIVGVLYGAKHGNMNGAVSNMEDLFTLGILLPNSRKIEMDADRIGAVLMAMAGYDETGCSEFWAKQIDLNSLSEIDFYSTHPSNISRAKSLNEYM